MSDPRFITAYFDAERFGALLFVLAGALAIALALLLLRRRSSLRGMAVPLIAVALMAPAAFQRVESLRMRTVIADLQRYRSLQLGLLALGMALVVLLRHRAFWFAFGMGLVLQAGLTLALDHVAHARAHAYFEALQRHSTPAGH